ncbi:MAG: (2Fe-2S)-binding protein [Bacteroidales bacterium]|jgi:NAD(P)H-nitrite reductase large subunit|nr:(2Fe-2S)-binding protein [Bacteroidales bacterium]NLM93041.1 (2Fe-2S)-binding protein [Bacteroidales bacterium]
MENDPIICTCNEIRQSEIEKAIKGKNLKTIEEVQDETSAGTVCGACVDDIFLILEKINGKVEL